MEEKFEKYRERYVTGVRAKWSGKRVGEVAGRDGTVYRDAVIRKVTATTVRLSHKAGIVILTKATAPLEWVDRFQLQTEEEVAVAGREKAGDPAGAGGGGDGEGAAKGRGKEVEKEVGKEVGKEVEKEAEKEAEKEVEGPAEAKDPSRAVVLIKAGDSTGTGFFVEEKGGVYLYTASHVLAGMPLKIRSQSGKTYRKFGGLQLGVGKDLARMKVLEPVEHALRLGKKLERKADVQALGNADGQEVVSVLDGTVTAIGPHSFELDAEVIQGNSGGPVVERDSGVVLGLVTHAVAGREDIWGKNTEFSEVRRFACRLDKPLQWQRMDLRAFLGKAGEIEKFDRVTRLLFALSVLTPTKGGLRLSTTVRGEMTALQIFEENKNMRVVQDLIEMNRELAARGIPMKDQALAERYLAYYKRILSYSVRQKGTIRPEKLPKVYQESGRQSLEWRKKAEAALNEQIKSLQG